MSKTTHVIEHDVHTIIEEKGPDEDAARKAKRGKLFLGLAVAIAVIGGGYYAYDTLVASRHVVTDNAYVGANVAQITPLVGGPVRDVLVDDTQPVKQGDVLVRLDETDAQIALERAAAALALTERRVRALVATDNGFDGQIARARADLDKARIDLERREALAGNGSVSGDELTAARNAFNTATASLKAVSGSRDANKALISGTSVENHPEVLAARAAREQALIDLSRTVIRAPIDGVVSKRQVQVGQRVQPGATMMVVVPLQAAYVDANFKEVQLARVRPGQPVKLHSDLYGDEVEFTGKVVGFSGGTGAAFAVVPAQNATGNWIKVVQRLPVRIALDPQQLIEHPLQVGLSMTADIDISR